MISANWSVVASIVSAAVAVVGLIGTWLAVYIGLRIRAALGAFMLKCDDRYALKQSTDSRFVHLEGLHNPCPLRDVGDRHGYPRRLIDPA